MHINQCIALKKAIVGVFTQPDNIPKCTEISAIQSDIVWWVGGVGGILYKEGLFVVGTAATNAAENAQAVIDQTRLLGKIPFRIT